MNTHTLFFDSTCPLCNRSIQWIQKRDLGQIFSYYPLSSAKAKELLSEELLQKDTLVLLEDNQKVWVRAKAVFRILQLLDRKWRFLGVLSHIPGIDLFYRFIAHNRHFWR